jgi:hypothetical protein
MESDVHPILLFDGVCNLCHRAMRFVLDHDRDARFRFAPLQSDVGRALLERFKMDPNALESVVVIDAAGAPAQRRGAAHRPRARRAVELAVAADRDPAPAARRCLRLRRAKSLPLVRTQAGLSRPAPRVARVVLGVYAR